jgi:hypothetical protein
MTINGKYKPMKKGMAPFLDQSQDTFTRMNIDPVERKKAIAEMKKRTKAYQASKGNKAPRKSSKRKGDGLTVKVLRSRAKAHNAKHCIKYSKLSKTALKKRLGL